MLASRPRTYGFTLVEVIVVVLILAICAAVVVPNVVGTSDMQATSAARMIAADLEYAQSLAITTQDPVTVVFDSSAEQYLLRYANESDPLVHPITHSDYVTNFASRRGFERLDVVSATFGGGSSVTFDELGAPDNAGTVVLQAGPHVYQVTVATATGKVTVASTGS